MMINNINLNLLQIFIKVYETQNMTKAAGQLFMTQSGVSQNIKHLEDFLGLSLFDRIKHRPVPTERAHQLYKVSKKIMGELEQTLLEVTGKERAFSGPITVGLPLEFGNNMVLPLLAKLGAEHENLSFHIKYGHAVEMNQLLMKGELDFAFVDEYNVDRQIKTEAILQEVLVLCCSEGYARSIPKILDKLGLELPKERGHYPNRAKFYEALEFVDYVEGAPVLKTWLRHHLGQDVALKVRASLMDVQGMSRVISEGLGVGILPFHVVERLEKEGHKLTIFKGGGKPLTNTISLAYLEGRSYSQSVIGVRNFLCENLLKNPSKKKN